MFVRTLLDNTRFLGVSHTFGSGGEQSSRGSSSWAREILYCGDVEKLARDLSLGNGQRQATIRLTAPYSAHYNDSRTEKTRHESVLERRDGAL